MLTSVSTMEDKENWLMNTPAHVAWVWANKETGEGSHVEEGSGISRRRTHEATTNERTASVDARFTQWEPQFDVMR